MYGIECKNKSFLRIIRKYKAKRKIVQNNILLRIAILEIRTNL